MKIKLFREVRKPKDDTRYDVTLVIQCESYRGQKVHLWNIQEHSREHCLSVAQKCLCLTIRKHFFPL